MDQIFNVVMYELTMHSSCSKCFRDEQHSMFSKKSGTIIFYKEDSPELETDDFDYLQMKGKSELVKGFLTIIKRDRYTFEELQNSLKKFECSLNYCCNPDEFY